MDAIHFTKQHRLRKKFISKTGIPGGVLRWVAEDETDPYRKRVKCAVCDTIADIQRFEDLLTKYRRRAQEAKSMRTIGSHKRVRRPGDVRVNWVRLGDLTDAQIDRMYAAV